MTATFQRAAPYAQDALNLPVPDVEAAIPFYERTFAMRVVARTETPHRAVVLARDAIQIGLAENGGDPSQEGCFFEVDDIAAAYAEIHAAPPPAPLEVQRFGEVSYQVFFVVAPDGLCYMLGQRA